MPIQYIISDYDANSYITEKGDRLSIVLTVSLDYTQNIPEPRGDYFENYWTRHYVDNTHRYILFGELLSNILPEIDITTRPEIGNPGNTLIFVDFAIPHNFTFSVDFLKVKLNEVLLESYFQLPLE
jgi:hypothetical protein